MIFLPLPVIMVLFAIGVVWYLVDFAKAASRKAEQASARRAREATRVRTDTDSET